MAREGGRDLSLVFLIDALGYELVGRGGFLDRLAPSERIRVASVLGFSSAAIPSILTGRLPVDHGHWSMYRRRGDGSVFDRYRLPLALADRLPRGRWRVRQWLTQRLRNDHVTGYFALYEVPLRHLPFFDLCERKNIYRPGAFDGLKSIFDRLDEEGVGHRVWDWSAATPRALEEMESAARTGGEELLFLYTSELDALMHIHGPSSPAVGAWLQRIEAAIARIVDAGREGGRRTRLRVFGDHGMARVHAVTDIRADLAKIGSKMPRDYLVFLDSTMARFWFRHDQARREVTECLSDRDDGRFVPHEELRELGVAFPDHAYGDEIFLVDPGILILPSYMGSSPVEGMHGYHPSDPDSDTVWIAEPMSQHKPKSIVDLAGILMRELGIAEEGP